MKKWGLYILIALGFAGYNLLTQADRDGSGAIVDQGSIDAFAVKLGDCFNDPSSDGLSEVSSLHGVPCSEPHDNETFAVFDLGLASFPGEDKIADVAFDACLERFEPFVGRDYESSSLDIYALYPTDASWKHHNDREVVCAVFDMEAKKLTGSVKGRAL